MNFDMNIIRFHAAQLHGLCGAASQAMLRK